jgi:hypothetical protein
MIFIRALFKGRCGLIPQHTFGPTVTFGCKVARRQLWRSSYLRSIRLQIFSKDHPPLWPTVDVLGCMVMKATGGKANPALLNG